MHKIALEKVKKVLDFNIIPSVTLIKFFAI